MSDLQTFNDQRNTLFKESTFTVKNVNKLGTIWAEFVAPDIDANRQPKLLFNSLWDIYFTRLLDFADYWERNRNYWSPVTLAENRTTKQDYLILLGELADLAYEML